MVLSGASEDGANGLLAVHQAGGATLVQRPSDAATPAMPLHAIQRCPQARVLGLDDIGMLLRDMARDSLQ
jgi:two-component system chemotaxis response regulator CheB